MVAQARRDSRAPGKERALIVACGAVGQWVDSVLAHHDAARVYTTSIADALRIARHERPAAFVTSFELRDGSALDLLAELSAIEAMGEHPAPCIVLLHPEQWSEAEDCVAAGATEVLELGAPSPLLTALTPPETTTPPGPAAAQVHLPVTTRIAGLDVELEAIELRSSGITLRGFPSVEPGLTARLTFTVAGREVHLFGQVIHCWTQDGASMAALRFVGLTHPLHEWLVERVKGLTLSDDHQAHAESARAWRRHVLTLLEETRPPRR